MFSSGAFTSKNNTPGALIFGKQPDIMSLERYTVILPPYDRNHPIKENQDEGAVMIIDSIDETNHLIYYKWSTQTQTAAQFNNVKINNDLYVNENTILNGTTTLNGDTILDSNKTFNVCKINCADTLEITATEADINGDLTVSGDITCKSLAETSDKRLKKNIEKIQNPLEKLDKINGYTFDWIENKEIHNHSNKEIRCNRTRN